MRNAKRWLAFLLALTLVCSMFSAGGLLDAGATTDKATGTGDQETLFSTSFEEGEAQPLGATLLKDDAVKNIGSAALIGDFEDGLQDLVVTSSITGSPDNGAEAKTCLFDNNTSTKWLCKQVPSASNPVYVSFMLSQAQVIRSYYIASANDKEDRDPSAWTLFGSNDGSDWKVLDEQSGVSFSARESGQTFSIENETAYSYYMLSITAKRGTSEEMVQLSELNLSSATNAAKVAQDLRGSLNALVDSSSIQGSADNGAEAKTCLFDQDVNTKWLTKDLPSEESPVAVSFRLTSAAVIKSYMISSANDSSDRDPAAWTLYGSNDGRSWQPMDSRSGIIFNGRLQKKIFSCPDNTTSYTYYKLAITQNKGSDMTQFSGLELSEDVNEPSVSDLAPLGVKITKGPTGSWINESNTGWTGAKALQVTGEHIGTEEAYATNVLYQDVNIPVTADTNLSYMIFPGLINGIEYDFAFMNESTMVDLLFTDGTRLSELGAEDMYGMPMTPAGQRDGKCLYTNQWNQVICTIGTVAAGKTVDQILLYYQMDESTSGTADFLTYFDDIELYNEAPFETDQLTDYVNVLRGSNSSSSFSRGLISPEVAVPHGFNMFTPETTNSSNFTYFYQQTGSGGTLSDISVNHVPSAWLGAWGTWQFMANTSLDIASVTNYDAINSDARAAAFNHDNEVAQAHYYSVTFDQGSNASGVQLEVTPTDHAAYVRVTFPADAENRNLIFDCRYANGGLTFNSDGSFTAYSDHTSNGSTRMYVYGQIVDGLENLESNKVLSSKGGILSFKEGTETVTFKLATSYLSYDQAQFNLNDEISKQDTFDTIYDKAQQLWEDKLEIIEVEGATYQQLVTLYSSMYRLFLYPINYSETDKDTGKVVYASPYQNGAKVEGQLYTINGFWDTYRTTWAAYALLTPTEDEDLLNGLVQHYKDAGWLARWITPAGANSMVGTSSDVIFGDAVARGITFDLENAFASAVKNATVVSTQNNGDNNYGRKNLDENLFLGYTPSSHGEGFSWSMEGYINDYGIAQMAQKLGNTDEAAYFLNRARYYVNLFNTDLGYFMGRKADGTFDYTTAASFNPNGCWWSQFTETSAFGMGFSVTQDGQGLANLYGGRDGLIEMLDTFFSVDVSDTVSGSIHEMREAREVRMGLYGHSNQPAHHICYMYDYAGYNAGTARTVRETLAHCYVGSNIGQGYAGDEDNGEMSAWYIFSALGFYPVDMGSGQYVIGSPLFTKATVHLEGGDLVINAPNNSKDNIYIQSMELNGESYDKLYLNHSDLVNGATIDFVMGSTPSSWCSTVDALPTSITSGTDVAEPAMDVTKGMAVGTQVNTGSAASLSASRSGMANLFDDTNSTNVTLPGDTEFTYFNREGKAISLVTLTSVTGANAPSTVALYGSNDGSTWTTLLDRSEVSFQWDLYTKPFAVAQEDQAVYVYYKLVVGAGQVAEIELLGNDALLTYGAAEDPNAISNSYVGTGTVLKGDMNQDGNLSVTDVVLLRKAILANATDAVSLTYGDMNGDGNLSVTDVVLLRKAILSQPTAA